MHRCLKLAPALALLASGCAASDESADGTPPVSAIPTVEGSRPQPRPEPAQPAPGVSDAVPADLLSRVREDLAKRTGGGDARLVSARAVEWPDGALGCPEPGQMYTQAIVPGYRIELESAGRSYVYHASQKGFFKLCPSGREGLPLRPVR